jgi:succinate dehydrogenase / fumarate reductase flavoprotein subunit
MWDNVGMGRSEASIKKALEKLPSIKEEFWSNLNITGSGAELNVALEKANRVADFIEFAEVMAWDALERDESCGAHYRTEHVHPDGEAKRNDEKFAHVAAWEYSGENNKPIRNVEPLEYENIKLSVRSYK